jgi:hypothetical protein
LIPAKRLILLRRGECDLWGLEQMRALFGTICLLIAATPSIAAEVLPTPAPLLGGGIAAIAVGGLLLASRLFKRN